MQRRLLTSHVKDDGPGRSILLSLAAHVLLVLVVLAAGWLLPQGIAVDIGAATKGGGQGENAVPVLLSDQLQGGGFGTVKPMPTSKPKAAPPKPEPKPKPTPRKPDPKVFAEKKPEAKKAPKPQLPEERPPLDPPQPPKAEAGDIVRKPDPGAGGQGQPGAGSGGGQGQGVGIDVGEGRSVQGRIDSYYVRLVERRVGQNWLRTSLGNLGRSVQTVIAFVVERNGRISDIEIVRPSGIRSVDLAAERAVRASNPLAPLPLEFRGRSIRFRAEFNYPPQ